MLNGAVVDRDSGSRFLQKRDGSVRGSRGDLYKTHVALTWTSTRFIDYDCDCPLPPVVTPGMCS